MYITAMEHVLMRAKGIRSLVAASVKASATDCTGKGPEGCLEGGVQTAGWQLKR
jgi:hypothetical protein